MNQLSNPRKLPPPPTKFNDSAVMFIKMKIEFVHVYCIFISIRMSFKYM